MSHECAITQSVVIHGNEPIKQRRLVLYSRGWGGGGVGFP